MNHLNRELAPIADNAWAQIEGEADRSLKHYLAARRLVDFEGPLGWEHSSVDLGRIVNLAGSPAGTETATRMVQPMLELRAPFSVSRSELAAAERGATDLDLDAVIAASTSAALAEDATVFHGHQSAGIRGIVESSPHGAIPISDDYSEYPEHVAKAVATLRGADVAGPYAIALGARCYTGVVETTEHGGYPVFDHLRQILGGPVVWAPAVEGAVVLSQRGGDFVMTVGQDFSIGYQTSDTASVALYLEESFTFRIVTPGAAVHLAYT